jgi:hypothetical protein
VSAFLSLPDSTRGGIGNKSVALMKRRYSAFIFLLIITAVDSGDGKSLGTAYVVISTHEEYVLPQVLGLKPGQQSLRQQDGHNYDVLRATDPKSNAPVTLYFNVDIPFKHYMD